MSIAKRVGKQDNIGKTISKALKTDLDVNTSKRFSGNAHFPKDSEDHPLRHPKDACNKGSTIGRVVRLTIYL